LPNKTKIILFIGFIFFNLNEAWDMKAPVEYTWGIELLYMSIRVEMEK
jgi:hypothetical protein